MNDDVKSAIEWLRELADPRTVPHLREFSTALLAHLDAEPARLAAAREEQREACAQNIRREFERDVEVAADDACLATPLTAQPLADELHNEREVSQSLRAQLHEAAERLDEFGSQPTLADGIQAMRLRLVDLRARVAELEEFVVSWKGWRGEVNLVSGG